MNFDTNFNLLFFIIIILHKFIMNSTMGYLYRNMILLKKKNSLPTLAHGDTCTEIKKNNKKKLVTSFYMYI